MFQTVFKRYESKYFTDSRQYAGVLRALERYTKPDRYGRSRICSVYYDTPDRRLIRASLEKPVYKEKLRLMTYGVPSDGSPCFIEIKKKYKGIVYKRRITADYAQALRFLSGDRGCLPPSQIKSETDFFLSRYAPLEPAAAVFYTRDAFYDRLDPGEMDFSFSDRGTVSGCDANGFTQNGGVSGGETEFAVELTSAATVYGQSGGMGGRMNGGMGGMPGGSRPSGGRTVGGR